MKDEIMVFRSAMKSVARKHPKKQITGEMVITDVNTRCYIYVGDKCEISSFGRNTSDALIELVEITLNLYLVEKDAKRPWWKRILEV